MGGHAVAANALPGLYRAIDLARQWAAFARTAAGEHINQPTLAALTELLSEREIGSLAAHYGANALIALARALESEADIEPTCPDMVITLGPADAYEVAGELPRRR